MHICDCVLACFLFVVFITVKMHILFMLIAVCMLVSVLILVHM